jgi:RND family efflux transporter MFP subunit
MADHKLIRVLHHLRRTIARGGGLSDTHLLERFIATGDEAAFELLVRRHERLVFGVCRRNLRDYHDAADAFQATFLALARKASSISRRQALAGWLYQVAYRLAIRLRARRSLDRSRTQRLDIAEETAAVKEIDLPAEWTEVRAILDEEVTRLPERFRLAIVLCYLEGKTVAEAGAQLGWPRGTVASWLARARERLQRRLVRRGVTLPGAGVLAALSLTDIAAGAPPAWIAAGVRTAGVATGARLAAEAGVAPRVVTLTREVLRAMLIKKAIAGVVVVVSFLLFGGGLLHVMGRAEDGAAPVIAVEGPKQPGPADAKPGAQATPPEKPKVARPVKRDVTPYADFTGRLEAARETQVLARVSGRLEKIHARAGASVKKGDLLFEVEATAPRESLARAEANLIIAEAALKKSESQTESMRAMFRDKLVSQEQLDQAVYQSRINAAKLKLAKLDLDRARRDLAATKITSPAAGRIGRALPNSDTLVAADKTLLATVMVLDPMQVVFEMDERSFLRYQDLRRKGEVQGEGSRLALGLSDDNGFPRQAMLASFDDRINAGTGTVGVRATLPNTKQQLLPGMFARIRMPFGKPKSVLLVPETAFLSAKNVTADQQARIMAERAEQAHIETLKKRFENQMWIAAASGSRERVLVVINKTNQPEVRHVQIGQMHGDLRVVEKGLRADEWVVIDSTIAWRLFEGMRRPQDSKRP